MPACKLEENRPMTDTPTKGWKIWKCEDGTIQVIPAFGRKHITNTGCWCSPHWDTRAPNLLVHECDN